MSDVLDYDATIIKTLHHIEEILMKFAIQNYAATGAVFFAFFSKNLPLRVAAPVVVVVTLVFMWAMWGNVKRYSLFWKIHRCARDGWLAGESSLRTALSRHADCEKYLALEELDRKFFIPLYVVNVLPALAAVALVLLRLGLVV